MKFLAIVALLGFAGQVAANGLASDGSNIHDADNETTPTATLKDRAFSATSPGFFTGPAFATGTDLFTSPNFATDPGFFTPTPFATGTNFFTGTGFATRTNFFTGTGFGTGRFTTTGFGTRFPGATITGPFSGGDDFDPVPSVNYGRAVGIPLGIILGCYVILGGIVIAVFLTRQKNRKAWYGPTAKFYQDGGRMVEASQPLLSPDIYGQQQTQNPFTTPSSSNSPAPSSQYDPNANYGQGGWSNNQQYYDSHAARQQVTYQTGYQQHVPV